MSERSEEIQKSLSTVNGVYYQFGVAQKNQSQIKVTFDVPYTAVPIILITSVWTNAIGYPEVVVNPSEYGFYVTSKNFATNYYINWLALGPIE